MKTLAYYNGSFGEIESIFVPITDRAYYFGDGIYDVAYCYNHKIFALDEHVDRFLSSARYFDVRLHMGKEELIDLIERMADKVDGDKLSVYFQCSRGTGYRDHLFSGDGYGNIAIMIRPAGIKDQNRPLKTMTATDIRHGYCGHKTLNLLSNVMAIKEAAKKGLDEVIFVSGKTVTECAHSNVSILKNGVLYTPPADGKILPGIAREHLLKQCERLGVEWKYRMIEEKELFSADEILVTASGSLCVKVEEINEKTVGGKDPFSAYKLQKAVVDEFNAYTGSALIVEESDE